MDQSPSSIFIGLTGRMRSGKTHIANVLIQNSTNVLPIIIPFAKPLKELASEYFGWDGRKDERGRKLLQVLGTEVGREYGGWDFWVKKWELAVEEFKNSQLENLPKAWYSQTKFLFIADDIRFSNEAEIIIENGGKVFEIINNQLENKDNHSSEVGIDPKYITRIIDNSNYSLLDQRILEIVSEFFPIFGV